MCSPASAIGSIKSGKYNAQIAQENATLANEAGASAEQQGAVASTAYSKQVKGFLGAQRASIAASGIEASGSALRVLSDTSAQGELNALTIRNNAARQAFGYKVQALNATAGGQLALMGSQYNAISTLLGGAAQGYGMYASIAAA